MCLNDLKGKTNINNGIYLFEVIDAGAEDAVNCDGVWVRMYPSALFCFNNSTEVNNYLGKEITYVEDFDGYRKVQEWNCYGWSTKIGSSYYCHFVGAASLTK